jgi:hypothetical protein
MDDPTSFTDAPAGHPASSSDPAAAQAPAGGRDLNRLRSKFLIVHRRYDIETGALVDECERECSDIDIAVAAGLDRMRLARLALADRSMIYELIEEGEAPETAIRMVEHRAEHGVN